MSDERLHTRVWRRLADEAPRPAPNDTVIRLALAMMAADKRSPLTSLQRQWVLTLGERFTPLTPAQRAKLKDPLLAYLRETHPRIYDIVEAQFDATPTTPPV